MRNIRTEPRIEQLIARAGIIEPAKKGDGRIATEPVLVICGPWTGSLTIFDQDGGEIGAVRNSRHEYELSDAAFRCMVRARKAPRRERLEFDFSVVGTGGIEIGTISREDRGPRLRDVIKESPPMAMGWPDRPPVSFPWAMLKGSEGDRIATVWERPRREVTGKRRSPADLITRIHYVLDRSKCRRYVFEDEPAHEAARLTYVQPAAFRWYVSYVLEFQPDTHDPLRTLVLATCVVVNNTVIKFGDA